MVNNALAHRGELFGQMYAADIKGGWPSIAAEKLLRAMLLQVLYSVRSERQLMECINARYGKATVHIASTGQTQSNDVAWRMKQERRTPRYTTQLDEIPIARA